MQVERLFDRKGLTAMMTTLWRRSVMVLLTMLTAAGVWVDTTWGQTGDVTAVVQVEGPGQPAMDMGFALGENQSRMDMGEQVAMISTAGSDPSVLMLQHPERRYMKWGAQQLQMMQQMMGQLGNATGGSDVPDLDPTQIQFQETGNTAQIGEWNAFEVVMTSADGEQGAVWLSTEPAVGLFELFARVSDAASALSMPMAGGGGGAQAFLQYQALSQSQGLPDGRVVRIVPDDANGGGTLTLVTAELGPIPASTFEPPADYQQMQMPSIPGLPQ